MYQILHNQERFQTNKKKENSQTCDLSHTENCGLSLKQASSIKTQS